MHVSFKIHYRVNLIDKKDSYLISCPPSWDDRNLQLRSSALPQWICLQTCQLMKYYPQ